MHVCDHTYLLTPYSHAHYYAAGITVPRVLSAMSTEPEGKKRAPTKKKATTSTKANTSKPRAKVATGRVTKKTPTKSSTTATKTTKAKKGPVAKAKDKVTAAAEKVADKVEAKPTKKGMFLMSHASLSAAHIRACLSMSASVFTFRKSTADASCV